FQAEDGIRDATVTGVQTCALSFQTCACPTGALTLRRRVQPQVWKDESPRLIPQNPNTPFPAGSGFLTADEMRNVWLYYVSPTRGPRIVFPFRSIPYAYLKWNEGSVRRIEIERGQRREL